MAGLEQALCDARSLTSDFGAESVIGQAHNAVEDFAVHWNMKVSVGFTLYGHVFPSAVVIIDWHHLVSAAVKTALNSLTTWPETLGKLRVMSSFFRIEEYMTVLSASLGGRR